MSTPARPVPSSRLVATLALSLAMVLWGSSFIAMKVAVGALHPLLVIFGRMLLATLLFAVFARRFLRAEYHKGDWKPMLLMGLCEPGLYFLFEAYALKHTSAAQAGMVTAMLPVMVAGAAAAWLGERPSPRIWAGFGLAVLGVIWLSAASSTQEAAPNPLLGNFLEFMAMVCATGYMLLLKKLSARYSPWLLTAIQALVGTLFYLPTLPFVSWPETWDPLPLLAVVYLGSIVTIGAYGCYNFGMSRLPASQASAFVNAIPAVSLLLAWLLLGETLNTQQLAACGVVFAGVFLSQGTVRQT
ncbi:MAG: DMT family transporter [Desulfovibrio sp.]|nr:DMT family transporter [Desulfovibrio sp.]MCA1986758.1 DMT family transporter [Desulfovibrio sp.]